MRSEPWLVTIFLLGCGSVEGREYLQNFQGSYGVRFLAISIFIVHVNFSIQSCLERGSLWKLVRIKLVKGYVANFLNYFSLVFDGGANSLVIRCCHSPKKGQVLLELVTAFFLFVFLLLFDNGPV